MNRIYNWLLTKSEWYPHDMRMANYQISEWIMVTFIISLCTLIFSAMAMCKYYNF